MTGLLAMSYNLRSQFNRILNYYLLHAVVNQTTFARVVIYSLGCIVPLRAVIMVDPRPQI